MSLGSNPIGDAGCIAIADALLSPRFFSSGCGLAVLQLGDTDIGDAGAAALAYALEEGAMPQGLAVINCCCCVSDRSSVRCRLSNKERIICNKELHKSVRQFPRAFVWFAADGTVQGCLRCQTEDTIDWSRAGLTAVDMTTVSLAIRCSWARCTSLQLSHNAIGDEGIALLASALLPFRLPHLETLEIEECRVTENVT